MTICDGCSREFPFLQHEQCMPCSKSPRNPKLQHEWPTCIECGTSFEHLAGEVCFSCKKRVRSAAPADVMITAFPLASLPSLSQMPSPTDSNMIGDDITYAMSHPVNVRTHGTVAGTSTVNPYLPQNVLIDDDSLQGDPRAQKALRAIHSFKSGYADAMARHTPHILVPNLAKSKLKGESQAIKPVPRIHVAIINIVNRHAPSAKVVFDPVSHAHPEDRPFQEVVEAIRRWIDGIYSTQYKHRIQSNNDFSLLYASSSLSLDPIAITSSATLRDLWIKSIEAGIHIKPKDIKSRILSLFVKVNYPVDKKRARKGKSAVMSSSDDDKDEDEKDHSVSSRMSVKRKADELGIGGSEGGFFTKAPNNYFTNVVRSSAKFADNASVEGFIVKKLTFTFDGAEDGVQWSTSQDSFKVVIEKKAFASGLTKHAYKLWIGKKTYCAKRFYSLEDSKSVWAAEEPSFEENKSHLQEELIRHYPIREAVSNFLVIAQKNQISVHDLKVAKSFLLSVTEGPKKGLTWIVDELLDPENMRKFSGTDQAGCADAADFAGITCDAFAHFTAVDSNLDFVVVDIQGIVLADA